jgi:hypothetical protein
MLPLFSFRNLDFGVVWSSKSKVRVYDHFVHLQIKSKRAGLKSTRKYCGTTTPAGLMPHQQLQP